MTRSAAKPSRRVIRYLAPVACVVMLGVGATACGSSSKTDTGGSTGGGATTPAGATTPSVATSEAQSGGAGF